MSETPPHAQSAATVGAAHPRRRWLYALPECRMPCEVRCGGAIFAHVETFKHDFFAATGLYRGPAGLAVLKLGRQSSILGIPAAWIGEWLARRELRLYRAVEDLPGVPRLIGAVGRNGLLHEYVPGHPLARRERVSDEFFDGLLRLLAALHARDIAYVDLNKRQNILHGDDGRAWLIDFQISLRLPGGRWGRMTVLRWLLRRFQQADVYHALKHMRRLRPDLLTADQRRRVEQVGGWIRVHRAIARPLTHLRRLALRWLQRGETLKVAGSGVK